MAMYTMYTIAEMFDGYSVGSLQIDWTYGLCNEKIPLWTNCTGTNSSHVR